MLNKNFYPTPPKIIKKMISDLNFQDINKYNVRVLDPSAGKGDILDYIKTNKSYYRKLSFFCIEKEFELQAILRDKKYKFIDNDFLTYVPDCTFDAIIMNPPFDNGSKHFLKAWEIGSDTEIRCLLPKQTLINAYTEERKLVKKIIDDNNGIVTELGNCFKHAERKTNVDVVLISIFKKKRNEDTYKYTKQFDKEKIYNLDDIDKSDIANNDVFGNMELRYNKVREGIKKMIEVKNEIMYYGQGLMDHDVFDMISEEKSDDDNEFYNNVCDQIRKESWNSIFSKTKMSDIVTTKTKKTIDKLQEQQGHMAFTAKNMDNLYSDLLQNIGNIMHDCVVESFDLLTKYHKENRCHVEGWKTNERFYINQKFILPMCIDTSFIRWNKSIHMDYNRCNDLMDIEKALCYLTNQKIEDITDISSIFASKTIVEFGEWYDSTFFEFKCFKKGTMHFKFKSEALWDMFNITACKGKNWIGC